MRKQSKGGRKRRQLVLSWERRLTKSGAPQAFGFKEAERHRHTEETGKRPQETKRKGGSFLERTKKGVRENRRGG